MIAGEISTLRFELARKSFHMLSLAYLAAYKVLGYPQVLQPMIGWTIAVLAVETARLRQPALNAWLTRLFRGLARPEENERYSGVIHTTAGALCLFLIFGEHPAVVAAAIYYVSFGDAAAAVVGKAIGRHKLGSSRKSVEGSLGCLLVCLLVGRAMGFGALPTALGAVTATVIEFLPTNRWFNDNFWMPVATAMALRLCAVS